MCIACQIGLLQFHNEGIGAPGDGGDEPQFSASAADAIADVIEGADAAGGSSTAYSVAPGQTIQGTLTGGDHDWYAVTLTVGQTYSFAMVGTGIDDVHDTYLRLYNNSGGLVAENDDVTTLLPDGSTLNWNHNSAFSFTATYTGTYFIDAAAWSSTDTGQYGVAVTLGSRPDVDVWMIAGIIDAGTYAGGVPFHYSWSATQGTGATVSVGFRLTDDGDQPNFSQFSAVQQAATLLGLQYFDDVSGLEFNVVGGYTDNATILLSNYNTNDGSGGYAWYPGDISFAADSGDAHIHLNGGSSTTSVPLGSYSFYTIMHELGHAVGLSHPGVYNAGPGQNITYATNAQFLQDSHQYTVMSYFDESNTTSSWSSYPDTLMMADILALQNIYGADYTTRSGNTTYGYNSNAGTVYDFALNADPVFCIWDGGGTDTLDCSLWSDAQTINLNAGSFSSVRGFTNNVSIAIGATIENATGGSGSDTLIGNNAATNYLYGNGGADSIYGLDGTDYLLGGTGADFLYGGTGDDYYYIDNIADFIDEGTTFPSIPGGGFDTLYSTAEWYYESSHSVETLFCQAGGLFGVSTIVGGGNANYIYGDNGNNNLFANWGNDWIYAGAGIDHVDLQGNPANILTEVDEVYMAPGSSWDIVWNFTPGVDNVNLTAYGLGNWATFLTLGHGTSAGNAYVYLAGGDILYFVGVTFDQLSAGDFVLA